MSWDYRVILSENRSEYAIHEVFYDDKDEIEYWTVEPVEVTGETLSECRETLEQMRQAFTLPTLEVRDGKLRPEHARHRRKPTPEN